MARALTAKDREELSRVILILEASMSLRVFRCVRSTQSVLFATFVKTGRGFGDSYIRMLLLLLLFTGTAVSQNTLTINVASSTGTITHGASGWLYGQAEADVPSQNLMAPLKPQTSAQKPPQDSSTSVEMFSKLRLPI